MTEPSKPITTNPQTLSRNNNLTLQISTVKLNGKNYGDTQSAKISLMGKGKFKYVNGTLLLLTTIEPSYEVWEIENPFIMSWLLHSIQLEISKTYFLLPTTHDI